ncbi:MAG: PKD domain-containing protein, partial [Bacteroidota bacterium]|nr:PKD domain-containing protein [Bacteroidota bacterium]
CHGLPVTFNDISVIPSGTITTWSWNFGDGTALGTVQNPVHTYLNAGSFSTTLIVTSNNGCKDTITRTVVIHPKPLAQFNAGNVCDGTAVTFTDQSVIASPDAIVSWAWDFGDASPFVNAQNTSHLYADTGSYNVELLVVSNFGCADSLSKIIVVSPNPVVNFTVPNPVGCEVFCTTFQNLTTISSGSYMLSWTFSDGNPMSDPHCFTTNSLFNPEMFDVSLTATSDSGCVTTLSRPDYITVYPKPEAAFFVQPNSTSIIDPIITVTDFSTGSNIWLWDFNDLTTSSLINPPGHTYADTGTYDITLITTTNFGCADTAVNTIIIEPDFVFYIPNAFTPNGSGYNDTFSGKGIFLKDYEMLIFDRWGNLIFKTNDINIPWDGRANKGGEIAQRDVYVYSITVSDLKGNFHYYKGSVTLIR